MLIDWFTVAAQGVNFVVLIAVLRHFLYRPLLRAVAAREQRMAAEQASARSAREQAERESARLAEREAQIETERNRILALAEADAQTERRNLLARARSEAEQLQTEWREALQAEFSRLRAALIRRTCTEAYDLTRRLLSDLAAESLQARMVTQFVARLDGLAADERSLPAADAVWHVRSAFALEAGQREALLDAVRRVFSPAGDIAFEIDAGLVCGLELVAGSYRLAWNAQDYLAGLEQRLETLSLATETATESGA